MNLDSLFNSGSITVWNAVLALLVVVAAFILAHFAKKGVNALAHRMPGLKPELIALAARLTKYAIIIFAIGVALALLGANVQPLLGAVILIAAVGILALRGISAPRRVGPGCAQHRHADQHERLHPHRAKTPSSRRGTLA